MWTIVLLIISNVFMTFAWYGHLKYWNDRALWQVVLISWGLAFFEYCFQVPANRLGHNVGWKTAQLKILQEAITLLVFIGFSYVILNEKLRWNDFVGFGLVLLGVFFVFYKW